MLLRRFERTCNLSSAAASPTAALLPQTRQLQLQHLQPIQDGFNVQQLVLTAARLLRDSDAVCKHNLVVAVFSVLYVLHVLHSSQRCLVFDLRLSWQIKVHGAEGGGGDVDVIDVVKDHRLVWMGQREVLLGLFGHQSFSAVTDYLSDQACSGELEEEAHGQTNQEDHFCAHDGAAGPVGGAKCRGVGTDGNLESVP